VVAVFSFGGGFNTMTGPGFFVPALRMAFYPAGKCGAKKGGVNDLGKMRSVAKRNGAILTFLLLCMLRLLVLCVIGITQYA
jgi:hypothetical protein